MQKMDFSPKEGIINHRKVEYGVQFLMAKDRLNLNQIHFWAMEVVQPEHHLVFFNEPESLYLNLHLFNPISKAKVSAAHDHSLCYHVNTEQL